MWDEYGKVQEERRLAGHTAGRRIDCNNISWCWTGSGLESQRAGQTKKQVGVNSYKLQRSIY